MKIPVKLIYTIDTIYLATYKCFQLTKHNSEFLYAILCKL